MSSRQKRILFICTRNSARSIMAEALMNDLSDGRFRAYSAGSHPVGEIHPLALETLKHFKIPSNGFRSKSWSEFAGPESPNLDFVLTVCDKAASEPCPLWPGQPVVANWGVTDPAAVPGDPSKRARAFLDTALTLRHRIRMLLALPPDHLDALSLRRIRDTDPQE